MVHSISWQLLATIYWFVWTISVNKIHHGEEIQRTFWSGRHWHALESSFSTSSDQQVMGCGVLGIPSGCFKCAVLLHQRFSHNQVEYKAQKNYHRQSWVLPTSRIFHAQLGRKNKQGEFNITGSVLMSSHNINRDEQTTLFPLQLSFARLQVLFQLTAMTTRWWESRSIFLCVLNTKLYS